VQHKFDESVGNYDQSVVKEGQMAVAIMGHHASRGEFGPPSRLTGDQRVFLGFGLDSYDRGDLDWAIQPRTLIEPSFLELLAQAQMLQTVTEPDALRHLGKSDDDIAQILAERAAGAEARLERQRRLFDGGEIPLGDEAVA
jgi:hypothetical protein